MKIIKTFLKLCLALVAIGAVLIVIVASRVKSNKSGGDFEKDIHEEVARDSIQEYEMAKRHGNRIEVCVRAGLVAEAYLQAKDEPNYAKWRSVERKECRE